MTLAELAQLYDEELAAQKAKLPPMTNDEKAEQIFQIQQWMYPPSGSRIDDRKLGEKPCRFIECRPRW